MFHDCKIPSIMPESKLDSWVAVQKELFKNKWGGHLVMYKDANIISEKKYRLMEDLSMGQSYAIRLQLDLLNVIKNKIPTEEYQKYFERIKSIEEDNYEEIIISSQNELKGYTKQSKSEELNDSKRIQDLYKISIRKLK